ncbi:hypothetical protein NRY95_10410 [Xanthomonas campestris pv. phormiicola]|nr:hypothetical protein [Xanthomonas campestris pv. phormiicola]UYC18333.1 hypothetical protein NRY95_10410 [Xanthomonas campestris pv. phormiicola]
MSRQHETQELYRRERDPDRAHAHRGSPWAWVILIALVLAASGWWMSRDRGLDGPANAPAPATPASDPPRAP